MATDSTDSAAAASAAASDAAAATTITKLRQTDFTPGTGNALQAAVASALGCDSMEGVPNFVAAPEGYEESIRTFLAARNLEFQKVKLTEAGSLPEDQQTLAAGRACIVRGTSPRGDFGHVVVGQISADGASIELVHDPHPEETMLRPPLVWLAYFPVATKENIEGGERTEEK